MVLDPASVLYISGPMTGHENFNYLAFNSAALHLRVQGYEVINPAETDGGDTTKPWGYYLRKDIVDLMGATAVAVLPGWEKSKGARLEVYIAHALGMPIVDAATLEEMKVSF